MAVSAEKWGCNKIRELASNRSRSLTLLLLLVVVVVQHSSVISVGLWDLGRANVTLDSNFQNIACEKTV